MSSDFSISDDRFQSIEEYDHVDDEVFDKIKRNDKPALLKGCDFGRCINNWSLNYLDEKLDQEQIVIHESNETKLDFIKKNFTYRTCSFHEFRNKLLDKSSNVYLRSTNRNPRAKLPARIENDFPSLKDDLAPPKFIPFGLDSILYHSSVLRVASSRVQIWTHFDLYDNVLCQVVGTKRIILVPPEDTKYLYLDGGDKSPVNNFNNWNECIKLYPLIKEATIYKTLLKPGQVLYLPALWWHNIETTDDVDKSTHSIGFNIFWRDTSLNSCNHYAEKDVYGNKNLVPYDAALVNLDKAVSHVEKLPPKFREFYKFMLLTKLESKLHSNNNSD